MSRRNNPPSAVSSDAAGRPRRVNLCPWSTRKSSGACSSIVKPWKTAGPRPTRAAAICSQHRQRTLRLPGRPGLRPQVAPRLREAQQGEPWPDTKPASAPAALGDFRIIREIGRGGMGVVYEAEQVSLGRRVALKVLPLARRAGPATAATIQDRGSGRCRAHHQNIVPVHGVGCERGVHYYAMQYIEGQPLSEVIRDLRRLEEPEAEPGTATCRPSIASPTAWRAGDSIRG